MPILHHTANEMTATLELCSAKQVCVYVTKQKNCGNYINFQLSTGTNEGGYHKMINNTCFIVQITSIFNFLKDILLPAMHI